MAVPESLRSAFRILGSRGLKVLYGPPLSCKTSLALAFIHSRGEKPATYVGLGKHYRTAEELKGFVKTYGILNFKEELDFLLSLHSTLREGEFLAYDGFGATLLPLRSELKESSVIRLAMLVVALLKVAAQTHSASVLVLTTETGKSRPLMFKALSSYSDLFIRVQREEKTLQLIMQQPNLLELHRVILPLDEIYRAIAPLKKY
ncbi:MAG: hypothetical protein QXT33_00520 [Thermofilum sp.]